MKKKVLGIALGLAVVFLMLGVPGAEEIKPLGPGVLSLDSSVGVLDKAIEAQKGNLEKALGIGISGFLDASYTYSTNRPGSAFKNNISGRLFDKDQNQVDFNDFNLTLDKDEKDWGVGFHIAADFGRTAELLRENTFWGPNLHREPSAELREAFFTFTLPFGEGLQVKAGKFVTPLGTEIIPAPGAYNDNISRSFAFNFAIPFTHTGVLFTYPFGKILSASAGVVTGWDDPRDNNGAPSFLGGINYTPADAFSLASNLIVGPEQPHNTSNVRETWSNVAVIKPIDPLSISAEYTLGHEANAPTPVGNRDAWWHAVAAIASYSWTDRFTTALRGEVFFDPEAARTFGLAGTSPVICVPAGHSGKCKGGKKKGIASPPGSVTLGEATFTASYKFTSKLMGRAEVRPDFADKDVFAKGNSGANKSQTTFALQAIYTY